MDQTRIIALGWLLLIFLAVFLLLMAGYRLVSGAIRRRRAMRMLEGSRLQGEAGEDGGVAQSAAVTMTARALSRFSQPESDEAAATDKFVRAGLTSPFARTFYYAARTGGTLLFPSVLFLVFLLLPGERSATVTALYYVGAAAFGYYLPEIVVSRRTAARRKAILLAMPDFLDLMVVCAEAGLGFDAAINRVGRELIQSRPELGSEFNRLALEMRAGAARSAALKNLSARIDIPEMSTLVAMLVQADKLGVSLVASLRTNAELLRVRRLTKAEELAAKIPVKITIPLFLFIFPTMFIIILGPAAIRMMGTLGK